MGDTTKIQWTHHTFNPWIGCTKVHAGCANCYAEVSPPANFRGIRWGVGQPRQMTGPDNWNKPLKWARAAAKAQERRRVFCASLADVLDVEAPPGAQERLWELIRRTARVGLNGEWTSNHLGAFGLDWLLLTKRPERWALIPEDVRPLVWLGTSISDQATADEWVPRLLAAEGFRIRFLSVEPMIGPINLAWARSKAVEQRVGAHLGKLWPPLIDWVIVGGESGKGARRYDLAWPRALIEQCQGTSTRVFHKQTGENAGQCLPDWRRYDTQDKKGGDPSEWPHDLNVREFPEGA
jgi:protein gp37